MSENEQRKNLLKVLSDVVTFFMYISGFKPYNYQIEFLLDETKRIIFVSGRQVGKTTICAIKVLWRALTHSNEVVLILSPTQRQSSLMFWKIREMLKRRPLIQAFVARETLTTITFINGSSIYCLPSGHTGDTVRGFSPTLIIVDEAAYVPDPVYTAIEPSLAATNGDMILLSTPFGKRGRFYEGFQSDKWSTHHVKSRENPLITQDFLEGQKRSMTHLDYIQEFEGAFVEESDTFLRRELIMHCMEDYQEEGPLENIDYFLGVDFARYGSDETVFTLVKYQRDRFKVVRIINTYKKPMTDSVGRIMALDKEWNFKKIYLDETGLGGGAVDILLEKIGRTKIVPVTFTLQNKEEMYKNLQYLMEKGRIIYFNHRKLINQLSNLVYQYTSNGHLKVHHPDLGHDDYPDSLALSVFGAIDFKPAVVGMVAIPQLGVESIGGEQQVAGPSL